jgi:hypothetical protein
MKCIQRSYVIHMDIGKASTKPDFDFIYNILFARRTPDEKPDLRKLINTIAITSRLKRTFKESEDPKADTVDELLIFWKFDQVELPTFKSDLVSVYEEKNDRDFKFLNRSKYFYLVGVPTIHKLSVPEQHYILHQLEKYLDRKPAKEIKQLCS